MILNIISKPTLDTIYKDLKVTKIFLKKSYKFEPSYKDYFFTVGITFILKLAKIDIFIKKQGCK